MKIQNPLYLKPLAFLIAAAFPIVAAAAPSVSASGAYQISQEPGFGWVVAKSGSFNQAPGTAPFSQAAIGAPTSYWDTSSTVQASADGLGHFATSIENSLAYGSVSPLKAQTQVVLTDTITNNTGSAQNVNFDFNIDSIKFAYSAGIIGYGQNTASFAANISVNGNSAWSSSFSAAPAANGVSWTSTGSDIGLVGAASATVCNDFQNCEFSATNYFKSLNLGALAANASLTVSYTVDLYTETNTYGGYSSIYFSDPGSLSTAPLSASLHFAAAPVPEPETASMLAAGLALLGGLSARRRRNKR